MNDETMREDFEKWVRDEGLGLDLKIVHEGRYFWHETVNCFLAYQAGMDTRAQASAPEGVEPVAWKITFGASVEVDNHIYEPISKTFVTDSKETAYAHISSEDSIVVPLYTHSNAKVGEVDDATLDRMCQAFYENKGSMKWDKLLDCWKENYRSNMRAALSIHDEAEETWLPIETAPKDDEEEILGWSNESGAYVVYWKENLGWCVTMYPSSPFSTSPFIVSIDYWMPLPEPPTHDKTKA